MWVEIKALSKCVKLVKPIEKIPDDFIILGKYRSIVIAEDLNGEFHVYDNDFKLYLSEFKESRLEYNSKQSRPSRMINNYFENVSNNEKKDIACEIILELGDKEYWDTKDENFKKKMSEVYKKQLMI